MVGSLKTIKLAFAASGIRTQHRGVREKTGWLGIRIIFVPVPN